MGSDTEEKLLLREGLFQQEGRAPIPGGSLSH